MFGLFKKKVDWKESCQPYDGKLVIYKGMLYRFRRDYPSFELVPLHWDCFYSRGSLSNIKIDNYNYESIINKLEETTKFKLIDTNTETKEVDTLTLDSVDVKIFTSISEKPIKFTYKIEEKLHRSSKKSLPEGIVVDKDVEYVIEDFRRLVGNKKKLHEDDFSLISRLLEATKQIKIRPSLITKYEYKEHFRKAKEKIVTKTYVKKCDC